MSEVYEPIIKIETGDAQKTVKSLKKDISDLRDVILNLEEGTDEYAAAVKRLQDDQRQLDTVMGLTKKNATALEGSYDALQHQMSLLRKEWKSTNDEARRNELGEQINDLNNKLKEFDASTGNFQRNVGNYTSALDALDDKTVSFKENMSKMNDSIEPTKAKFESVQKISAGVASGFAAVQGAAALLGKEGKNLEEVFVKVQSAMAIAQGVGGVGDLVEGVGKAKVAFQGLGDKIKVVSKAMGKAGWIGVILAVVSAIAGLTAWIIKTRKETQGLAGDLKAYNKAAKEKVASIGEEVAKLKIYQKIATDTSKTESERSKAAKELLTSLNKEVSAVEIAKVKNGEYTEVINEQIAALIARAKAEAAFGLAVEKYNEAFKKQEELKQNADKYDAEAAKRKAQQESGKTTVGQKIAAIGMNMAAAEGVAGANAGTTAEDIRDSDTKHYEDKAAEARAAAEKVIEETDAAVNALLDEAGVDLSNLITVDSGNTKAKIMTVEEALKMASEQIQQTLDEDLAELDTEINVEINEEDAVEKIDKKNKKLKDSYNYQVQLAERTANREKELARIAADEQIREAERTATSAKQLAEKKEQIENEYNQKIANIDLETANKRLELIDNWVAHTTDANDLILTATQERADAEVEIEKAKNEKIKADTEAAASETTSSIANVGSSFSDFIDEFNDNWDDMGVPDKIGMIGQALSQSFQAAGDIMNAIADDLEENGEANEKNAKKVKNLRIATATMDMLSGIVGAISSAAPMGPVGWALGAIQAATIATIGGINISKIKNTDFNGGGSGSASVTPQASTYTSELPVNYTRSITSQSEIDELNKDSRVYILESDIQASNKRVQIRESESSF